MLFRTRLDIINQQTNQCGQSLLIPNGYGNISAQVWANPTTREAKLVIDGKPLSETMLEQIRKSIHSPEMEWMLQTHEHTTDLMGKTADGLERGYHSFEKRIELRTSRDSLTIYRKEGNNRYKQAKIADNYKNNGPAIVRPNPDSIHKPGSPKYRAKTDSISLDASRRIRGAADAFNEYGGSHLNKLGKASGLYGDAMDAIALKKYYDDKDYDKVKSKLSGMVGGKLGARAGATIGVELGMALPIPVPVAKVVVVALLGLGGGIAGAFGGEKTGEWLYSISDKVSAFTNKMDDTPPFQTFPTDINSSLTNIHLDSKRLFDPNQDVIGYSVKADGGIEPINRSDLSNE
ncbi:hypothetical protein [uncultured Spirosoma sp.]|uniref:hypothetical protein n=1 Tax=uncultured Spirosoma sp. TaxID=278208 RepID=UPI00258ECEED|nr:hypothetical protein [uncultured Spirosoma sp.]